MALLYRIAPILFEPHDPQGAVLHPGRWHHKGHPVLYFCTSLPGCFLEKLVADVSFEKLRNEYHFCSVEADLSTAERIPRTFYPADWTSQSDLTRERGTDWLIARRSLLLEVRSATVGTEFNYLINPAHPDFAALAFSAPGPLEIHSRLK